MIRSYWRLNKEQFITNLVALAFLIDSKKHIASSFFFSISFLIFIGTIIPRDSYPASATTSLETGITQIHSTNTTIIIHIFYKMKISFFFSFFNVFFLFICGAGAGVLVFPDFGGCDFRPPAPGAVMMIRRGQSSFI